MREKSIRLIIDIWLKTSILQSAYYILHIPVTPPTLVSPPSQYFKSGSSQSWDDWTSQAMKSLRRIRDKVVEWLSYLKRSKYQGFINLELFSPEDLKTSLGVVSDIMKELGS